MSKDLFRYDAEHFEYQKVHKNLKYYVKGAMLYLGLSVLVGALLVWGFFALYDSPETVQLRQENQELITQQSTNNQAIGMMQRQLDSLSIREANLYRTALNAEPEAADHLTDTVDMNTPDLDDVQLDRVAKELDDMTNRLRETTYSSAVILEMASMKQEELRSMPAIRPVPGEVISGFGKRIHPITKQDHFHGGIDLKADVGTPVRTTGSGYVQNTGILNNGMGNFVEINHGNGYVTRYAHLSAIDVRRGQRVKRGDVIAYSGASGLCKGPHLFYQILKNGDAVDPIDYFYTDLSPQDFLVFKRKAAQYNESMN